MAQLLGRETMGLSEQQAAESAIDAVEQLRRLLVDVKWMLRDKAGRAYRLNPERVLVAALLRTLGEERPFLGLAAYLET